jgi:short-subunit dehydrogenase
MTTWLLKENVMKNRKHTALITGASSSIGAIAADRLNRYPDG